MRFDSNNFSRRCIHVVGSGILSTMLANAASQALGQDASLLQNPLVSQSQMPLTLDNSSYIYQKLPPDSEPRELRINDILTVLVDYNSTTASNGNTDARKTSHLNAELKNWLKFDGKNLMPAPQNHGDLHVDGELE